MLKSYNMIVRAYKCYRFRGTIELRIQNKSQIIQQSAIIASTLRQSLMMADKAIHQLEYGSETSSSFLNSSKQSEEFFAQIPKRRYES